jgi:hypothetical protein
VPVLSVGAVLIIGHWLDEIPRLIVFSLAALLCRIPDRQTMERNGGAAGE